MDKYPEQTILLAITEKMRDDANEYQCKICGGKCYLSQKAVLASAKEGIQSPLIDMPFKIEDKHIVCGNCAEEIAAMFMAAIKATEKLRDEAH